MGNIFHSSWGRFNRFFCLKDRLNERKFTVSPVYSCLSRIAATVEEHQLCGNAGGFVGHFTPVLCKYSLGVITPSERSFLAIWVGPRPDTLMRKIRRTTSAAGSSTSHLFLSSGAFLYPKGGLVVRGIPALPRLCMTRRTLSLVFFACHSLNKSCMGTMSLTPLAVSMLSMMAIYRTFSRTKSSSKSWPTTSRLRPSREWSFTTRFATSPCSASSMISMKAGRVKVTPE